MPCLHAYFGLTHFGRLEKEETVVVSCAEGTIVLAVDLTVDQIAKLHVSIVFVVTGGDKK